MARTTSDAVKLVLMDDYGLRADGTTLPDLTPYIDAASSVVDDVVACITRNEKTPLSTTKAEIIERWLGAHFYQQSDPGYASKSTGGASASFVGQTGMYLESTRYGQMAMTLDPSGCLRAINKGARASASWLGKIPSNQIPIEQRT